MRVRKLALTCKMIHQVVASFVPDVASHWPTPPIIIAHVIEISPPLSRSSLSIPTFLLSSAVRGAAEKKLV